MELNGYHPGNLDRTEKKVALLLQHDGRMSFTDMAKRAGVTEPTIRRKFNNLIDNGYMKIAAFANPFDLGYLSPAIMGIDVQANCLDAAVQHLMKKKKLRYVAISGGLHDLIIEAYCANNQELLQFTVADVDTTPGLMQSTTYVVLTIFKIDYGWGIGVPQEELVQLYEEIGLPYQVSRIPNWLQQHRKGTVSNQELLRALSRSHRQAEVDETERKMIQILQRDGRMSYVDMARRTEVSKETVRRKFQRLVDEDIIRVAGVGNPMRLGLTTPAVIGLSVERSQLLEIAAQLCQERQVVYVAAVTGSFDLLLAGYFRDNHDLGDFIVNRLGHLDGVNTIRTSLVFNLAKQTYDYGVKTPVAQDAS